MGNGFVEYTLELLEPADRARVVGLLINRFRGDPSLLTSGLTCLEERTGCPVLGVVPFLHDLRLPAEDSQGLDGASSGGRPPGGPCGVESRSSPPAPPPMPPRQSGR